MSEILQNNTKIDAPSKSNKTSNKGISTGCAAPEKLSIQLDLAKVSQPLADEQHVLFSPMHYEPGYAYPLLVWLHGPGDDERQIMRVLPLISMRNFVGIAPRGVSGPTSENQTNPTMRKSDSKQASIPELVLRLDREKKKNAFDWVQTESGIAEAEQRIFDCISIAKERCNIAPNRIFLVGFDSGGTMAFRIATQYPQYFAGVISLGGRFPEGGIRLNQWNSIRNLPTLLALGKDSSSFSPEDARDDLKLFHTAGLNVSVRQYACGQEISPQMLQDVNRWIMERVCVS